MSEKKTWKWKGWMLAMLSIGLVSVLSISGAQHQDSPIAGHSKASRVATSGGAELRAVPARAETDTLDLQLD